MEKHIRTRGVMPSQWRSSSPKDSADQMQIYTSDYGSYSSQDSNHSGNTTYSSLADYDEIFSKMTLHSEKRKPSPPPRIKSDTGPPVRPYKPPQHNGQSVKDNQVLNSLDISIPISKPSEDNIPSYATLSRKKKQSKEVSHTSQGSIHVSWMEEVAQKGESMKKKEAKPKSSPPAGILKKPLPSTPQQSYITRATVQKVLERQRAQVNAPAQPKVISAQPSISQSKSGQTSKDNPLAKSWDPSMFSRQLSTRPWEWHHADPQRDGAVPSAQVIGVIEPSAHLRQPSQETEFEFPAPPTELELSHLVSPRAEVTNQQLKDNHKDSTNSHPRGCIDYTPLSYACQNGGLLTTSQLQPRATANDYVMVYPEQEEVIPPPIEFSAGDYCDLAPDYNYNEYHLLDPSKQAICELHRDEYEVNAHGKNRHVSNKINGYKAAHAPPPPPRPPKRLVTVQHYHTYSTEL